MKRVVVTLAHGFEGIGTVTVVDILRRAGISVMVTRVEAVHPRVLLKGRQGSRWSRMWLEMRSSHQIST
jgi:putative intracellular protease/amidase